MEVKKDKQNIYCSMSLEIVTLVEVVPTKQFTKKKLTINETNLERKRLSKIKPDIAISSSYDPPNTHHGAPEWLWSLHLTLQYQ